MEIHWVHSAELSEGERLAAEERIRALEEGHTDLIDVRITVRSSGHHKHGDKEVRIVCEARGKELVAARTRDDVGLALNEVLDAFEREVRRLRDRRSDRRTEQPATPPHLGVIDRVFPDEDYGFVLTDSGEQVYFHRNAVHGALDFDRLGEGDRVSLNLEGGEDGPQATVVREAPPDATGP